MTIPDPYAARHRATEAAFLPADHAGEWTALGFRLARRPYSRRCHFATRDGTKWFVDLEHRRAQAWGTGRWVAYAELAGMPPETSSPQQVATIPEERADLDPFIQECLAAGFELVPDAVDRGFDLGNRWVTWRDGRTFVACVSSRSLVGRGLVNFDLREFRGVSPVLLSPRLGPSVPFTHSGNHRVQSLFS